MTKGYFGEFGGQFIPPSLQPYLDELEQAYEKMQDDPAFQSELRGLLQDYVGRPSPLYLAKKLGDSLGCKVYLKEDLNHTGAHKINNTLGQGLLAKFMGKTELIAETGAGQHGVATATIAALLGMKCKVFMGAIDVEKQQVNVDRMEILGAEVVKVTTGGQVLKDAVDVALGYLIEHPDVFYLLGSVVGPHPYPTMVRNFQKIVGEEAKEQIIAKEGRLPDVMVACVGGGSNAMGLFHNFVPDTQVTLVAVEPAGKGLSTGEHAATLSLGKPGVLHGFKSYLLQDEAGEPLEVYSIASGLDYPGVGPEFSFLKDSGRVQTAAVTDQEALDAFYLLSRTEGIIPALESSHAIAYLVQAKEQLQGKLIILNLSGRGDKDVEHVCRVYKK